MIKSEKVKQLWQKSYTQHYDNLKTKVCLVENEAYKNNGVIIFESNAWIFVQLIIFHASLSIFGSCLPKS